MAYRTYSRARRSYTRTRAPSRAGARYARTARKSGRSAARTTRTGRGQTVRIEIVGMPANPVSRALPAALKPVAPKKAKH